MKSVTIALTAILMASPALAGTFLNPYTQRVDPMPDLTARLLKQDVTEDVPVTEDAPPLPDRNPLRDLALLLPEHSFQTSPAVSVWNTPGIKGPRYFFPNLPYGFDAANLPNPYNLPRDLTDPEIPYQDI